mgnify:FL=1
MKPKSKSSSSVISWKEKLEEPIKQIQKLLKKWRYETKGGDAGARKEISEVLEVEVRMGHISRVEMLQILKNHDRVAANKVRPELNMR